MGLLDDLSMGLGLKERDDDYYDRTAKTLGRTQGAGREAQYRQSRGFGQTGRRGLLSGFGGGSDGGSSGQGDADRPFLAQLLGYRDYEDMFDRGGRHASGGMYRGAGGYSLMANLAHALSGQEFGERTPYEKIKAEASVKSTNGAVPEATRNALSGLRPMLRPDNLNVPGPVMAGHNAPTPTPAQDYGYDYPAYAQNTPAAPPAPMAQAATGLTIPSAAPAQGVPEMGAVGGSEEAMRQRMRNAGYDPTGLGPLELQTFIEAMGL
jgi:hypothetical protein